MEQIMVIAIYAHATLGGIGLVTGIGSMTVKKGGKTHKLFGKVFSLSMISSCIIIVPIAWLPGHKSLFLFLIALFTIYLVLIGRRALTFKSSKKRKVEPVDLVISRSMLAFSAFMIVYGFYALFTAGSWPILYLVFGGLGLFLTIKNFIFYKNFKEKKKSWVLVHLTHMIAGMIAAITAFIVAGFKIWTISAWVLPSILGTIYIIFWRLKVKKELEPPKTV